MKWIRQKTKEVKLIKKNEKKFILFIDLKQAYNSVDHQILFKKLQRMEFSESIINKIKLLYSNARIKISVSEITNVNRDVLQCSLISPMLFDR